VERSSLKKAEKSVLLFLAHIATTASATIDL
jgi:hypothetical protein